MTCVWHIAWFIPCLPREAGVVVLCRSCAAAAEVFVGTGGARQFSVGLQTCC